jgi:6,7-dimethyl-8-ribityllumazine synthase
MPKKHPPKKSAARRAEPPVAPPLAIVVSRYNESITDPLLIGAMEAYERAGGDSASLAVVHAPGAFELPTIVLAAAESGRFAGVVALGCVIRGQTRHDRYLAQAVARGLMDVSLHARLPVAFGVLTTENAAQARERAGGSRGNKGSEAMQACLDSIAALRALGVGPSPSWSVPLESPGAGVPPAHAMPDKALRARPRRAARGDRKGGR